jgi:hypothetical protein
MPLLVGCASYTPILPSTPLVQKGEVEASATWMLPNVKTVGVAYSPVKHLLVEGQYADRGNRKTSKTDTLGIRSRQYEIGLGYYHSFKNDSWYVGAIGGYGQVWTRNHNYYLPIALLSDRYIDRDSRYLKYFGQVYGAYQTSTTSDSDFRVAVGLSLRYTAVRLTYLSEVNSGYPVGARTKFYTEPTGFLRMGNTFVQGQLYAGLAATTYKNETFDNSIWPQTRLQLGAGVVLNPTRIYQRLKAQH